jgi:predicted AlkP superfamily pyrophosphatase or phosphodiesterase
VTPSERAARLVERRTESGFVTPAYGDRCFAGLPGTCYALLGADVGPTLPASVVDRLVGGTSPDRVVAVVVDGFGWDQLTRERGRHDSLDRLLDAGRLEPLTSTFPSETAAAMTTFRTATYPHEHGVVGWFQYVASLERVVLPLPFTTVDGTPLSAVASGFDRAALFRGTAAAERARPLVTTTTVRPAAIGADYTYEGLDGFADSLAAAVDAAGPSSLVTAYVPQVDAAAHRVGTRAGDYHETVGAVFDAVAETVDGVADDRTLFLVTADHGHVDTDPATNVDLRDDRFDRLWETFRRRPDGTVVPPTGSPRQLHLHVRDGARDDARTVIGRHLDAHVLDLSEATERELWGPGDYDETFRSRLGDLLVVPRDRGVWYGDDELAQVGMHGGATRAEMLVPLLGITPSE